LKKGVVIVVRLEEQKLKSIKHTCISEPG